MFEHLKQTKILVSGPQRSGTRICAKMVAQDTGLPYVDETDVPELFTGKSINDKNQDWGVIGWEVAETIQKMIDSKDFVLHCPPFMPWLHYVKGAMVIVMRRPVDEIVRSAKRIDWKKKRQELEYNKMGYTRFSRRSKPGLTKTNKPIAELKYLFWEQQNRLISTYMIINYHDLQEHSLWIPPTERANFKWDQTSL